MTTQPRLFGVVAVIFRQSKFLVIRRSKFVSAPRAFCFPGGGIEPGESEPQALIRELEEELDITKAIPVRRIWHSVTGRNVDLAWWLADVHPDETMTANPDEVESLHWWSAAEMLLHDNLLDSNREFLNQLELGNINLDLNQ